MSFIQNQFERNFVTTSVDYVFNWARKSAIWPMTFGLACCAIEMIASSTSRFDIARFVTGLRTFAPVVAGAAEMPYPRFAVFNITGATGWICSVTLLTYWFGNTVKQLDHVIFFASVAPVSRLPSPANLSERWNRWRSRRRWKPNGCIWKVTTNDIVSWSLNCSRRNTRRAWPSGATRPATPIIG